MVTDIVSMFKGLKTCIEIILCELQSIQSILEITNEQFPIYENLLYSLQHSINNLMKIYNYKIPIQHVLKFELLNIIHIKLKKFLNILTNFTEWNTKIIKPKCFSFEKIMFLINSPKPSNMLKKLEKVFIEIEPLVKDQIILEDKILGNAIRIEHPILQKAWLMVGGNQLNETSIPLPIIVENLYAMYLIENNNYVPNKEYILTKITDFLHSIDGLAGLVCDNKISIIEMNMFKTTEDNSKSVKAMINISDNDIFQNISIKKDLINNKIDENNLELKNDIDLSSNVPLKTVSFEPININIPINFKEPVKVSYLSTRIIKEPLCIGYGADFNNINACEFKILDDLRPNENYTLFGIDIECIATDQGFGGTNQCHMHYQINDRITIKAFQVDRNQYPNNIYKFSIPPEKIELNNIVKLWIFSPQWNGWSMTLSNVKAIARFIPI